MATSDLIQSFVARYRREYDFYYEVARLVAQRCEELSAENGIRGIVTFRAKRPDRLEAKLIRRDDEKHYNREEDIRADIVDLSGVRIALYFPSDLNISRLFSVMCSLAGIHGTIAGPGDATSTSNRHCNFSNTYSGVYHWTLVVFESMDSG
jgi:ppGpp synthetase/RelA/SpoT-type nucleotidyltranferase